MWALRTTEPPHLLGLASDASRSPQPRSPYDSAVASQQAFQQQLLEQQLEEQRVAAAQRQQQQLASAQAEAELSRLVELSDVGSLLAERVTLSSRVQALESAVAQASTHLLQSTSEAVALSAHLAQEQDEAAALKQALQASQREVASVRTSLTGLQGDLAATRSRGEEAERRAWQLQALMASQATAAAGVVTDWVGGADRARAQRLAFYNEHLAEAQERAAAAEAALAQAHSACTARLANETLALRLQAEAAEHSASGRLAVMGLQLRGEQGRSEELQARLEACEAALREALRGRAASEAQLAEAGVVIEALRADMRALRATAASMRTAEQVESSLSALRQELMRASAVEVERVRAASSAQVLEAQQREAEAVARVWALEQALAAAAAGGGGSSAAALAAPPPDPAMHISYCNPMLPAGFNSIEKFLAYIRSDEVGMTSSQLAIFVDCTLSNSKNPNKSYVAKDGSFRSLHDVSDPYDPNPYVRVIRVLGKHLEEFDDDKLIPLYGFGDRVTKERAVFPYSSHEAIQRAYGAGKAGEAELAALLAADAQSSQGIEGVLALYTAVQVKVVLQGPTSIAPAIEKTIEIVEKTGEFTICLIIADGFIDTPKALEASKAAVVRASRYPISIILVGVGDGEPGKSEKERWAAMNHFDEELEGREFDNFHFLEHNVVRVVSREARIPEDECFALMALAEIPDQYQEVVKKGILKKSPEGK